MKVGVKINRENINKLNAALNRLGNGDLVTKRMKYAARQAAKKAAKILGEAASERYVTDVGENDIEVKQRGASAALLVSGPMTDLQEHRVSSFAVSNGRTPAYYSAQVLQQSGMKQLVKHGNKVFVAKMKNGHVGFFVRADGKKKDGEVIESVYALNKPEMIGNPHVYGEHEEEIGELLNKEIAKRLDKLLA